jgi:hypothetical protein
MKAVSLASAFGLAFSSQAPDQPHLAQAWTALSTGDGLKGETGVEHYIYERDVDQSVGALNGHVFDYGASCTKIELDAGFKYPSRDLVSGTYYINCDGVDCCYGGDEVGQPADVKKFDINKPGLLRTVKYLGLNDTTELNGKPVKQAEVWQEVDKIPFTKGLGVTYDYYITRKGDDVVSHRIDLTYPGGGNITAGSILYGNFTIQHNMTAFRDAFRIPPQCQKNNLLKCDDAMVEKWGKRYFKRSHGMKSVSNEVIV